MSGSDAVWQELTITALLGTQRRAFSAPEGEGDLGSALRAALADGGTAETAMLRAASLLSVHRRAGQQAAGTPVDLPPACPPDERPRCSAQAGRLLETILNTDLISLLPEWVDLAGRSRQRVREEHLAPLLSQRKACQPLRKPLLPVLGERGRWLARQNPEWQGFDRFLDDRIWLEGTRKERAAFLSDLREEQPDRARRMLEETWPQESPAERVGFLHVLETNLSMEDEPFLESVLNDRRKDVRAAAAALLARLPLSRLAQRMTMRARNLVQWKSGLLRSTIEVRLPEACDDGMQRDGIDPKGQPRSGLSEQSSWLVQILAAVPPSAWSSALNRKPEQILAAVHKHDHESALFQGWLEAASAYHDTAWLEALLVYDLRRSNRTTQPDLFAQLPVASREKLMTALLREQPSLAYEQPAATYLAACRFGWSQDLTHAFVQCVCAHLYKGDLKSWQWERLLRDVAPYPHPDVLPEAVERISNALSRRLEGDAAVAKLLSIFQFRLDMHRAFGEQPLAGAPSFQESS